MYYVYIEAEATIDYGYDKDSRRLNGSWATEVPVRLQYFLST